MAAREAVLAPLIFCVIWGMAQAATIYNVTEPIEECPYVPGMHNFSIHRHLGEWDVVLHLDAPFLHGLSCVYFDFVRQEHRKFLVKIVGLRDIERDKVRLWRNEEIIMSYTCFFNHSDPAVMVILDTNETALEYLPTYVVVDTDYVNYSVLYSCFQPLFGENKFEFLWILKRRNHRLPTRKIQHIIWGLERLGVNTTALRQAYPYFCERYTYKWLW